PQHAAGDPSSGVGGNDTLYGGSGDDRVIGDAFSILGDAAAGGNDWLHGGAGNDTLVGDEWDLDENPNGGNDTLLGGAGDDLLRGNGGNDSMDGGAGSDTASFVGALSDYDVTRAEDGSIQVTDLA